NPGFFIFAIICEGILIFFLPRPEKWRKKYEFKVGRTEQHLVEVIPLEKKKYAVRIDNLDYKIFS
ncbi:MAG: hypothetical protein ACW964_02945, partial [Candidatus Hodarchaeales archaeon]